MDKTSDVIKYLRSHPGSSSTEIEEGLGRYVSKATIKRYLAEAKSAGEITSRGKGRATTYYYSRPGWRRYPDGIQTFEKIISEGYVYVDKTDLVYKIANETSGYVFLSRPRRFGKSLLISTLKAYFEARKELFEGLSIASLEKDWEWHPVVRLDLSTAANIQDKDQLYLKLSNILSENEASLGLEPVDTLPGDRLDLLVRRAYQKYGKKVVILVDEYDAPILDTLFDEVKAREIKPVIKDLFSPLKKLDPYLRFTFITGITKFSQMSIFSTLNNLDDVSLDDGYAAICGFTDEDLAISFPAEMEILAAKKGVSSEIVAESMKQKYDGYHFSPACIDIYNPFSILKAFSKLKLANYWFESGTPTVLIDTLKHFSTDIYDLDGAEVTASAFSQPTETAASAVPIFYQSGYLTIKSYDPDLDTYVLSIPNAEVRSGLMDNLVPILLNRSPIESQNLAIRFKKALLKEDIGAAMDILKAFFASIPYPEFGKETLDSVEKKEAYFKRLFYIVFSFMNIQIYTEVMNSCGRTDALMFLGDTVYVIEAKLDAHSARIALEQIDNLGYADRFVGSGRRIVRLGLNFSSSTRTLADWCVDCCD
ncbi:MAG: AAA family ATPase [Bacteroidales bacterium]|nr:AAA family ATPase [Bacteroidales bacterium]